MFNIGLLLALTSCGFNPLYDSSRCASVPELELIKIEQIPDREGQILKNYLIDNLTPYGKCQSSKYVMTVKLQKSERYLAFRRDYTPRQNQLIFLCDIELRDIASGEVIYKDKFRTIASYTAALKAEHSSFSSVIANESESNRALRTMAENIKIRLASFFENQK